MVQLVHQINHWLQGSRSRFKVDDSVQLIDGNYLMVVVKIETDRNRQHILIECQWYDPESQSIKMEMFPEQKLKAFEWNIP